MIRRGSAWGIALVLASAVVARGQEWAEKMFTTTSHDFGSVARGAATQFRFEFSNPFEEPIHVQSAYSSCGCTSPTIEKDTLTTFEKSAIIAKFNTDSFFGHKSATVTVTFDKPMRAQVQLRVSGNIRTDVVFNPGRIDFAGVDRGKGAERITILDYAAGSHWKLKEAKSSNEHLTVEYKERGRGNGRVSYEIISKLDESTPIGDFNDQILFVSEDGQKFPLSVTGRVVSEINVSPETVFLGEVAPEQLVTKKLIVRSAKPFKIVKTEGEPEGLKFEYDDKADVRHLVTVSYTGTPKPGLVAANIRFVTDLGEEVKGQFSMQAQVVKPRTAKASPTAKTNPVNGASAQSPLASAN